MKNKNYKIVVIGDLHGRSIWEDIVKKESDADLYIFLGDYFDSFTVPFEEQETNFADIVKLKIEQPEKVILLIGNHEYHYLSEYSNDHYSGYQTYEAHKIDEILTYIIREGLFQIAYQDGGYIFTHAGITKTWMENNKLNPGGIVAQINLAFNNNPAIFKFTPSTGLDNNGDSITQSPIWVRPRALESDKIKGVKQVVGHTYQKNIDVSKDIIYIDTLEFGNEYLVIKNGKPKVERISKTLDN